jgi:hypothetical protein
MINSATYRSPIFKARPDFAKSLLMLWTAHATGVEECQSAVVGCGASNDSSWLFGDVSGPSAERLV